MANKFIEKEVTKERTGANVSPIQVDTQSRYLLNPTNVEGVSVKTPSKIPVHENMFIEAIGKIAKESEQLKLNNEKNLLDIAMKNKDLEFEEKWSTVQDKYGDRFEEYLKDYNEVIKSKKSLIVNSKYLDSAEKRVFSDNIDINYKDWGVKEGVKRNQYYIKEQNDIALATLEQRRIIGAKYSLNDDEKAKENYTYMRDTIEQIAKLSGMSEEEKIVMLGKNIGGTEVARLNNRIMEIQNSSMTLEQKKIEIDKVLAYMDNEKIINDLVDTTMEFYKGDDEKTAKEYLKVQFEGETKSVLKGIKSQIDEYQREQKRIEKERIRAEKQMQRLYLRNLKMDQALRSEKYTDVRKAFKKRYGRDMTDEDIANGTVNFDWASAGDLDNYDKVEIFDKDKIENLKRNINAQIENGRMTEVEAKNLVRDYAEKLLANDNSPDKELKVNAFIKQYADTENPIPYAYGKEYPELYQANNISKISKGNNNIGANINKPKQGLIWNDDGYSEWEDLKKEFSSDPVYADAQLKNYLASVMKSDGLTVDDMKKKDTVQNYLKKLSTDEGKRLINASKVLKGGKPTQNTKSNTISTKKNKMGGYLR
ncbi:hypothetical protein KST83_10695 [Fusobacterium nucleatum]|uniref:Uncharacterized protein n=1 Tax=Fusobacterium nucleatum subsp. polymorphum TaxID=76857 RepID=A0A2C6AX38_FUSNP|nr:hypothetical protein [Fusobacterium polymorphum]PHH96612.1 hypothetical protein CA840_04260 [Fusobacterium polymorphum]